MGATQVRQADGVAEELSLSIKYIYTTFIFLSTLNIENLAACTLDFEPIPATHTDPPDV